MAMKRDDHENLLTEMLNPDLPHDRRTEIAQLLRTDYTGVHDEIETFTTNNEKLTKDREELLLANSKLFREVGILGNDEKIEEEKVKEFSETVTIESLEKRAQ